MEVDGSGMRDLSVSDKPVTESTSAKPAIRNTLVGCVAIVNHKNGPLYMRVFEDVASALPRRPDESVELQMQEVIYNSLDVIEERISSMKEGQVVDKDGFLGCLAVVGPLSLYGFETNTRQKIVIALKSAGIPEYKDTTLKSLFKKLHAAVVNVFLNPFIVLDEPIRSVGFDRKVDDIACRFA